MEEYIKHYLGNSPSLLCMLQHNFQHISQYGLFKSFYQEKNRNGLHAIILLSDMNTHPQWNQDNNAIGQ